MKTESFRGRDFLTLLDYTTEEVETILDVALDFKRHTQDVIQVAVSE